MWISHAKRVLSVLELRHALAVRLEDSELDRDNFVEPQLIVDSCYGMVEIDEKSSTIRFVHYSLQEYSSHINTVCSTTEIWRSPRSASGTCH